MKATIFYSWQSDIRAAANRTFIQEALENAVAEIRSESSILVQPVVDRDTRDVPGAPDIGSAILEKIDACAAMVADVTIVTRGDSARPSPNPNVLIELGYGLKAVGDRRLVLVLNDAFGGPEMLPFDLRRKRVLTYSSPEESSSRADEKRRLQAMLREALSLILATGSAQPASEFPTALTLRYRDKLIKAEIHHYSLDVFMENTGMKPITEWHVDVEFPTCLLEPKVVYSLAIPDRSDDQRTLFRSTQDTHKGPIYPGDKRLTMSIDYRIDEELYYRGGLLDQVVTATAYVHGTRGAVATKQVKDINRF